MPILPQLVSFLRRPVFIADRAEMNVQSAAELLKLLGLTFVLALISVTIASGLYSGISGGTPEISKDFAAMSQSAKFAFMAIVFAPLTEELLFRSWLGRVWGMLLIMPILLALSAALALLGQGEAAPTASLVGVLIVMGSLGLYVWRYLSTRRIASLHEAAAKQIFPYVFWGSAGLFALIHMSNYAGVGFQPLIILLVMPQFIVGVILGFVRMRYGLLQAIGFHAAYNGVFVGLSFLG